MLVLDQKERCGDWAKQKLDIESWGSSYECIGWEQDGALQAVAVFTNWTGPDVALHIAAVPGRRWLRREALRAVFRYAFNQLGVRRITGYVPETNRDAWKFDTHLGFKLEGVKRDGWHHEDMLVLGMIKSECRYL
jgi:RimJ/RimL family protein N-acetyltransferase